MAATADKVVFNNVVNRETSKQKQPHQLFFTNIVVSGVIPIKMRVKPVLQFSYRLIDCNVSSSYFTFYESSEHASKIFLHNNIFITKGLL